VAQGAVAVREDDTEASLAARVLAVEHRIYPLALKLLAEGRLRVEGPHCHIAGSVPSDGILLAPGGD